MSENKRIVSRLYDEVFNGGQLDALDCLAREDYVEHDPLPGQRDGRAGLNDRITMLRTALAPTYTLDDLIAEHDKVVARWTSTGTHVADFMGVPATNKSYTIAGVDIYRLTDDLLAEHWHVVDQLSMLRQLGVIPPPGSSFQPNGTGRHLPS